MNITLVSILIFGAGLFTETPNFYPTYPSAREASRMNGQEMVVFFTAKNCTTCKSAWLGFEKDIEATKRFVSTSIDKESFDGEVLFDLYQLQEVPSWIILDASGQVKQKWEGGWKDGSGVSSPLTKEEIESSPLVASKASALNSGIVQQTEKINQPQIFHTASPPASPPQKIESPVAANPVQPTARDHEKNYSGHVIQAGYFGSESNAQNLLSSLKAKGIHNYVVKSTRANGSLYYRVISNPYPSSHEAQQGIHVLTSAGFKGTIKTTEEL